MNTLKRPGLTISWIGAIVTAEVLGRRSPSDVWDALGVCVFVTLVALTIVRIESSDLRVAVRLRSFVRGLPERLLGWWPDMGIDLRGTPPVPRAFPGSLIAVTVCIGAVAFVAFAARTLVPGPARAALLTVSPTIYLLGLSVAWVALISALGVSVFSLWRDLDDHLRHGALPRDRYATVLSLSAAATLGLVAALVFLVPLWLAWTAALAVAALASAAAWAIDRHEKIRVLWRSGRDGRPYVFHAGAAIRWDAISMALLLLATTIPAAGVGRGGHLAETMPITVGLAAAATWTGVLAFLSYTCHGALRMLSLARHDPGRREPVPLVFEKGTALPPEIAELLGRHGFRSVASDELRSGAPEPAIRVRMEAVGDSACFDHDAGTGSTVRIDPARVASLSTLADLRRLDDGLLRGHLVSTVQQLLQRGYRRSFSNGTGFWIAPHLWYVLGLTRDSDDPDYYTIGPPYHRVLARRARQHLHAVLKAVEVDLVFAEDGASIHGIAAVFDRLFDLYDVLGPRKVEDADFAGIRGVKVILHDFTVGEPAGDAFRGGYREPEYEELGRARILHVMIERGGEDEDHEPAPAAPDERPHVVTL